MKVQKVQYMLLLSKLKKKILSLNIGKFLYKNLRVDHF